MVQIEDFEFQLVDAEAKTLFKEHSKDGKTYVEAEPDAEYFMSIRKTRVSKETLYCKFLVDGQDMGYSTTFPGASVYKQPGYRGVFSRINGISTHKALKFVKAAFGSGSCAASGQPAMGQVQLQVFKAVYCGVTYSSGAGASDFKSSFSTASVDANQSGMAKKKNLRSGEGTTTISTADRSNNSGPSHSYSKGAHLYNITLNYCAAVGLIAVGVLDKPPLWDYHRMLNPAKPGERKNRRAAVKVKVKRTSDGKHELLDLVDEPSDDEDENESNTNTAPQNKKMRHQDNTAETNALPVPKVEPKTEPKPEPVN